MIIKGVSSNSAINAYNDKKVKRTEVKEIKESKDSIEISSLGKTLSSHNFDVKSVDNAEKVERLSKEIKAGTYKPSAELVAKKMLAAIRGSEF